MANYNAVIEKDSPLLVTGAAGFVGKNLVARLRANGYTCILEYDVSSAPETLAEYAQVAKFVFHLAGVNRPKDSTEFQTGNTELTQRLLALLREHRSAAPVLLTSSAQAGNGSDYAISKEAAETAVFQHGKQNSSDVFVYRLPGVFGKWSRPAYNSVVATFCHNVAQGIPLEIRDPNFELPLCYIDDVVNSFIAVLLGQAQKPTNGHYLGISPIYTTTLGALAGLIQGFKENRTSLELPNLGNPFEAKLYATYLSFLPVDAFSYPLAMNCDDRGSFTEFLRTAERGQISVNVAKPGIAKGNHWHDTKNEKFLVVSGEAVIRFRKIGSEEIFEYPVNATKLTVVDIPTGYTHTIENVGSGDLVTVMWASEAFDPDHPDTYFEKV